MQPKFNILSQLVRNENQVTRCLYALVAYPPVREVVMRLLTGGAFGSDDVIWSDFATQTSVNGSIPDLIILNPQLSIVIEIKTSPYTSLTYNQPSTYIEWLRSETTPNKYFIFLVPSSYDIELLRNKLQECPTHGIRAGIICWEELIRKFKDNGLHTMNQYVGDFCSLLSEWYYTPEPICTVDEVRIMFDKTTPDSLAKLFSIIEEVLARLEKGGFTIKYSLNKGWWNSGEYGGYIVH